MRTTEISAGDWVQILDLYTEFKRYRQLQAIRTGRIVSRKTMINNYIQSTSADFLP